MKRAIMLIILILLAGCAATCPRCAHGQSVWANDLVITATEAREFKQTVEDLLNHAADTVAETLFQVATGSNIPTGTHTVTLTTAQLNRWFSTADLGSFVSRVYWELGNRSVKLRLPFRAEVLDYAAEQAPSRINNETKRQRFLDRIEYLKSPVEGY